MVLLKLLIVAILVVAKSDCCRKNSDCRGGFCVGGRFWSSGTCQPLIRDGWQCTKGDPNSCRAKQCTCGYCGRTLSGGYKCSTNANCASGWCNGRYTFGCRGLCRPKIRDGQRCRNGDGNSCASGQCTCGYCGRRLSDTKRCSTNDNCASGWCDGRYTFGCKGRCRSKTPDGQRCRNGDGNSCASGQCTCGYCGRKLPDYFKCATNDNCKSRWCHPRTTIGCRGRCQPKRSDYQSCVFDDNQCSSGRCEKVSRRAALCSPKNGFRVGSRCNEDTDCDKTKSMWCRGGGAFSSGICTQCPSKCPDGCNAIFNNMGNMKCGRMTTFDHALNEVKKIAKPFVDFIQCFLPVDLTACALQAIKGASSCINPSTPCRIKLGGVNTNCLAINNAGLSFNKEVGPVTFSGSVTPSGGFVVDADVSGGAIRLELYGRVAVKADLNIKSSKDYSLRKLRKLPLSAPKLLFRKVLVVGVVPVIIEVKIQAVAQYSVTLNTRGTFEAGLSYNNERVISIKKATATFDPKKGVNFDVKFGSDFHKRITNTLKANGNVQLVGVFRIGPEITISVNGIPMRLFPALRLVAEGSLSLSTSSSGSCFRGSIGAGIGLDTGISVDFSFPKPATLFGMACRAVAQVSCKNPLVKAVSCAAKVIANFDPCKEALELCSDLEKEITKITPENLGKTFTGTAIIIPAFFVSFSPPGSGKRYCNADQKFSSKSSKSGRIGAGRLRGGGGGRSIQTCGAPGVKRKCPVAKT